MGRRARGARDDRAPPRGRGRASVADAPSRTCLPQPAPARDRAHVPATARPASLVAERRTVQITGRRWPRAALPRLVRDRAPAPGAPAGRTRRSPPRAPRAVGGRALSLPDPRGGDERRARGRSRGPQAGRPGGAAARPAGTPTRPRDAGRAATTAHAPTLDGPRRGPRAPCVTRAQPRVCHACDRSVDLPSVSRFVSGTDAGATAFSSPRATMKTPMSRFHVHDELYRARGLGARPARRAGHRRPAARTSSACSPARRPRCAPTRASAPSCATARSSARTLERIALAVAEHYGSEPGIALHARTARQAGLGARRDRAGARVRLRATSARRAAALPAGARRGAGRARRCTSTRRRARPAGPTSRSSRRSPSSRSRRFTAMVNVAGDVPGRRLVEEARSCRRPDAPAAHGAELAGGRCVPSRADRRAAGAQRAAAPAAAARSTTRRSS